MIIYRLKVERRKKQRKAADCDGPVWPTEHETKEAKTEARMREWKRHFHSGGCCVFFLNSIPVWTYHKVPYKLCESIYYWCCVCGCGPIAEALWGIARLLTGTRVSFYPSSAAQCTIFNSAVSCFWSSPVFVARFFCLCMKHYCSAWIIEDITELFWPVMLTSLFFRLF